MRAHLSFSMTSALALLLPVVAFAAGNNPRGVGAGPFLERFPFPVTTGGATEAAVAVDPRDGRRVAVLATDYTGYVLTVPVDGGQARLGPACRLFLSSDAGRHWQTQDMPGTHLPTAPYTSASNSSVSIGADGTVRAVCLANNSEGGGAVIYAADPFGSALVPEALPLSPPQAGPAAFPDKPWITTTPDGNTVTVAWGEFLTNPGTYTQVLARTSHDGGVSFGPSQIVSAETLTTQTGGNLADPLYLHSGALIVAWHATAGAPGAAAGDDVLVSRPGMTGSTVVAVTGVAASGVQATYPRHANQPAVAEDPRSGRLYVAIGVQTPAGVRSVLARSDDGGRHWSSAIAVLPETAGYDQLNAAVAVNATGHVAVIFQDVRAGKMTTELILEPGASSGRHLTLSTTTSHVLPYTAISNGSAIGEFLSITDHGTQFITAWPEQRAKLLQLQLAIISTQANHVF